MKHLTIITAGLLFLFIGCKKEGEAIKSAEKGEKHQLVLQVSELSFSSENMSLSAKRVMDVSGAEMKKHISNLYLDITHGYSYQHVAFVHQDADDPEFGKVAVSLPDGYYIASLSGSRNTANIDSTSGGAFTYTASTGDTFVGSYAFEVSGSNVTWNAKLERVVGKFKLNFTTKVPDNVKRILIWPSEMYKQTEETNWPDFISFGGGPPYRTFYTNGTEGFSIDHVITEAERKKSTFSLDIYVPADVSVINRDLVIITVDEYGNEIYYNQIKNVPIERNRITTITGNPFGEVSGFDVKLDNTWQSDSTVVSF